MAQYSSQSEDTVVCADERTHTQRIIKYNKIRSNKIQMWITAETHHQLSDSFKEHPLRGSILHQNHSQMLRELAASHSVVRQLVTLLLSPGSSLRSEQLSVTETVGAFSQSSTSRAAGECDIPSRSSMVFSSLATDLSANSARVSA